MTDQPRPEPQVSMKGKEVMLIDDLRFDIFEPGDASSGFETLVGLVNKARGERDVLLYAVNHQDFSLIGLTWPATDLGACTETNLDRYAAAKRLRDKGLVTIKDSSRGPVVRWAPGRGLDPMRFI